jgi:hypothetical protein
VPFRPYSLEIGFMVGTPKFVSFDVTPRLVDWGEEVRHVAVLKADNVPLAGARVQFQWYVEGSWRTISEVTTDRYGGAVFVWKVPYEFHITPRIRTVMVCKSFRVRAYAPDYGVASNEVVVRVATKTRITASTNKTLYAPGETVTVTGKLEAQTPEKWEGLPKETVKVTWWDGTVDTVTTGAFGDFTVSKIAPTTPGTYRIKIEYAGKGLTYTFSVGTMGTGSNIPWLALAVASAGLVGLAYARRRRLI